jgi:hypothetical protein
MGAMKNLVAALLALALCGCASFAKRLEVTTVRKIHPQQTTRAEVEKWLGQPKETVVGAQGVTIARYFFSEFRRSTHVSWHVRHDYPGDILSRTLTLAYNASNVVARKLHDESVTPIYRTNAWFFAGPELTPQTVSFIQHDVTMAREVMDKLGEPASRSFNDAGQTLLVWYRVKTRETSWRNPNVQRLILILDDREVVRGHRLVEHALSEFEPLTLH